MSIFFSSDFHFGHNFLIERRGFKSVEEMDLELIKRINSRISPNDILYFLGDWTLRWRTSAIEEYRQQINCKNIHFVLGNHDREIRKRPHLYTKLFLSISDLIPNLKIGEYVFCLCHYPMRSWNKMYYGSFHLYGHSHSITPVDWGRSIDVGVDTNNLYPYSLDEIVDKLKNKEILPHHDMIKVSQVFT